MVNITKIYPVGFAANSYLITQDDKTAILIDAAQDGIMEDIMETGLRVTHVLLTHGHFDHTGGCATLKQMGAKIGCYETETEVIEKYDLSKEFGTAVKAFKPDFTFTEETLSLNGIEVKVIFTPGHTQGSVCFAVEDNLFTGDTLFHGSIGRTDFATGDEKLLEDSIRKLYALSGDYKIYAGHNEDTTLSWERKNNSYIREA